MRWFTSLRRSGEIAFVRRRGRSVGTSTLVGYALPTASGSSRICISVSKSVGGAVLRNLVKRRVRGALETLAGPEAPMRMLVVAKPPAATAEYERLASDLDLVLRRLTPLL
jgi:ribonuclease P protein component